MNTLILLAGVAVALTIAAATVHLTLSWMERRGWVYYRMKDKPRPSSLGLVEEIFQPSIEHVTDEQSEEQARADRSESGESEEPGSASDL